MYLNLIQIAESFGVAESVVEGWVRDEGLPHTPDRGRLLFDRTQVTAWAASRGLAAQAGFLAPEASRPAGGWSVSDLLRRGGVWRDLPPGGVTATLQRIVGSLPGASPAVRELLAQRLLAPGGIAWAPVGGGVALPHPGTRVSLGRESGVVALLLLREGLPVPEPVPDAEPITRLLFFIAPSPRAHLDLLGRLSRLLARGPLREILTAPAAEAEIIRQVAAAEQAALAGDREGGA